ncbi:NAD(P)-dependent oxidoreductase [Methanobrevibacter sp. OttesenSCG-928-K11]|nr:NAD(P)-dependent oxidoreductase [Methanobrevibacter sp. OttesenSCG-928-K11]MDL2246846.1 NAD(P)-dependent oxidoreductase [Methanobrevibacter sp. OttesenSCG-928-K11]MDL2271059.1 NAD(P)-dependent oxidoreductase [Methanobrevibacter sp. OttesenSCG-928-I08]
MIIGFIGFGKVNSKLNSILSKYNIDTVTSIEGRSDKTINRIIESGIDVLDSFKNVVSYSDIIISATSPHQAENISKKYAPYVDGLFLDLNNISIETTKNINSHFKENNFIDGAIIGKIDVSNPILFLSGEKVNELEFLNNTDLNIKIISQNPGDVSILKMLRSSYTKSLSAILIESIDFAKSLNLEDEFFDTLSLTEGEDFKDKSKSRILSTYKNSKRKTEEIDEVLNTFKNADTTMTKATKEKFKKI